MKKLFVLLALLLLIASQTQARLVIEITEGVEGALPIAVVPFKWTGDSAHPPSQSIGRIVAADLRRSGYFQVLPENQMLTRPATMADVDFRDWRALKQENLVIGNIEPNGPGGYKVRFQLFDVYQASQLIGYNFTTTEKDLRAIAHHIADLIYETLTGTKGAFATRIAYVVSEGNLKAPKISLRIADSDGYNAQTIVSSGEPLMSPAWSPDGRKLAYVSFENGRPSIWIQEVFTGKREKVTSFKGINGAPAWSPDGRYLAMALSKDGNPDIYIMDLARKKLRRLVRHWAIETEPSWSPDGRNLLFTSDRGGSPQIYQVSVTGGNVQRLTFENKYNARASYAPDGKSITLITRVGSQYRIGVLDLENGSITVLTDGKLDESPSFAPNGSMIIYATRHGGKGVLAAVSTDGRVKQRLALQSGDVRDPVWSPYYK
ncbi:Tol-Pal system beta propeller repeat protein TolB [Thiolapillus brandeum]|uniref:Tol-Pal system protein TolB n=1 Tax=Thiolapillus brandeum TaxID=1076588 RepID=A0A7U6GK58_9GAMM|nr:Tol-Pal system beta propeller repeat protein TolB [Thiolapillus brandeum]BAO45150.1 biopolymer transport protein TolB [Thiolapillus brandeum]